MPKLEIHRVKDSYDKHILSQHNELWQIPFRLLIVGASLVSGKTNLLINLLTREEFYYGYWLPQNIYIISESLQTPKYKLLIDFLDIPHKNLYDKYNEVKLKDLYAKLQEEFLAKKEHSLIIFDDVLYSNEMNSASSKKKGDLCSKLFCNGRHFLISSIVIAQEITQISKTMRSQCTGACIFEQSESDWETINQFGNKSITTKSNFIKTMMKVTEPQYSFVTYIATNQRNQRWMFKFDDYISFDQ